MSLALDAAELLFNCLANVSGGDWTQQSHEWRDAAAIARGAYHKALDANQQGQPPPAPPGRLSDQRILAVLRSDYELVLRLAADRLRSLDTMTWPPDPGPRQAPEPLGRMYGSDGSYREVPVETPPVPPGREDLRRPFCADHPDADRVTACEVCVEHENRILREQLTDSESQCLKLAREVDESKATIERWAHRAAEAEREVEQLKADLKAADVVTVSNSTALLALNADLKAERAYRQAEVVRRDEAERRVEVMRERLTWVRGDALGTQQPG